MKLLHAAFVSWEMAAIQCNPAVSVVAQCKEGAQENGERRMPSKTPSYLARINTRSRWVGVLGKNGIYPCRGHRSKKGCCVRVRVCGVGQLI